MVRDINRDWTGPINRLRYRFGPLWARLHNSSKHELPAPPWEMKPQKPAPRFRAGSRCVKGSHRETNEDRCYADSRQGLFFVADGMGGHVGGSEASRILMETLPAELRRLPEGPLDVCEVQRLVEEAIDVSHLKMAELAHDNARYAKMGSTLALALVRQNSLFVCHVGDCRVYLLRGGKLRRLTKDQTFVQALVDAGMLTLEEAQRDPRRHLVLNAVSAEGLKQRVQVTEYQLEPGDRVILATDGLTSVMDDDAIRSITLDQVLPQHAADELILDALHRDSRDNIACVVVKTAQAACLASCT